MADGYPIEEQTANSIQNNRERIRQWPYSRAVFLTHPGEAREAPRPGEIFRQADLAATLRKMAEAGQRALAQGRSRRDAIMAAYDRFYRGDIAQELVRSVREQGGLFTMEDLANWRGRIEEPSPVNYPRIVVSQPREWSPGPDMLPESGRASRRGSV